MATLGGLERRVRAALNDTVEGAYRWDSPVVLTALVDAVKRLNSIRPESRYFMLTLYQHDFPVTDGKGAGFDLEKAQGFELKIDTKWEQSLVYYAMARCLEIDSADTANLQLAADYFAKAERAMLS